MTITRPVEYQTGAEQAEAVRKLLEQLAEVTVDNDVTAVRAWLQQQDPVLAHWVEARIGGLRNAQTNRLDQARGEQGRLQAHLDTIAARLREDRVELKRVRTTVDRLRCPPPPFDAAQVRAQLDQIQHPALLGINLVDQDLVINLRFLMSTHGRVYDVGDWQLNLSAIIDKGAPVLHCLRSGRHNGEMYWYTYKDAGFDFTHDGRKLVMQQLRESNFVRAFSAIANELLGSVGDIDATLEQLRVVSHVETARTMRYTRR